MRAQRLLFTVAIFSNCMLERAVIKIVRESSLGWGILYNAMFIEEKTWLILCTIIW